SGNGNNGTLTNFDFNDTSNWTTGKVAGALQFDGSNDYILKSDNASLSVTAALTLESWIKLDTASAEQTVIGKWDETTANNDR
ncbi:MAG: hypothetical protein COX62_04920, partial [Deltaproteobacteria bacterium CG_4_10_14_0_2_um_filter_43_8]